MGKIIREKSMQNLTLPVEKNIYLIRHCNRLDSDEPDWRSLTIFPHQVPLSTKGVFQAHELGEFFRNINVDAIFSSPFLRCVQTAFPVSCTTFKSIKVDNRLSEWLKVDWFDEKPDFLSVKELFNFNPTVDLKYNPGNIPSYPEENKYSEVKNRVDAFWNSIPPDYSNIVIVTHGTPIMLLLDKFNIKIDGLIKKPTKGMIIHVKFMGSQCDGKILKSFKEVAV